MTSRCIDPQSGRLGRGEGEEGEIGLDQSERAWLAGHPVRHRLIRLGLCPLRPVAADGDGNCIEAGTVARFEGHDEPFVLPQRARRRRSMR